MKIEKTHGLNKNPDGIVRCDRSGTSLFRQFLTRFIDGKRQMGINGNALSKALVQPDLPWSGCQKIGSPYDMADSLFDIVCHDGQLIGEKAVGTQQYEIADIMEGILGLVPLYGVVIFDNPVRNFQTPGASLFSRWETVAAGARVNMGTVDSDRRIGDFLPGTSASIYNPFPFQDFEHLTVKGGTFRLANDLTIPFESAGFQCAKNGRLEFRMAACGIDILDTDDPFAAICPSVQIASDSGYQ